MYTVSQKTSHLLLAITLTHMNGFFGRNVTDKVGNQKMLYYATNKQLVLLRYLYMVQRRCR